MGGPLIDNGFVIGEIDYVLRADDTIWLDGPQLLALLYRALSPEAAADVDQIIGPRAEISLAELAQAGIRIDYDPATFQLEMQVDTAMRPRHAISVSGLPPQVTGPVEEPADFSAYVTALGNLDYVHEGSDVGLASPNILLDGAIRYGGFVLEGEANWQGGFSRQGTRLIYDDRPRMARFTAGDLQVVSRGFSGASPMTGLSLERLYSDIDPQRNIQPRGQRSFTLERASTVETYVNGSLVQQTRLNPGTYDIQDFPFAQGANDVQLVIRDDSGRSNTIDFTINFDRNLLAAGLSEFGVYGGVRSPFSPDGRRYTGDPVASGFYRRGLTEELTAGGNFQVVTDGAVLGGELVWASPVGTLGFDLAGSQVSGIGSGYAFNVSFERAFDGIGDSSSLIATYQTVSRDFATADASSARNPYVHEMGLTWSLGFLNDHYISVDGFYSQGRVDTPDRATFRAIHGWRAHTRLFFTTEATYQDRGDEEDYGIRLTATLRFGPRSSGTAEVDTRRKGGRLTYQTSSGRGVGSYNGQATVDYFDEVGSFNGNASIRLNRSEVGAAHLTSYSPDQDRIVDQRTSLRFGTSFAVADGAIAMSHPIYDSFAMLKPHKSMEGAKVYVSPTEDDYLGNSGVYGPAVAGELSAYTPQLITYDAPEAPVGYDLGTGAVQMMPPYRSGYLIEIGSAYSTTFTGTLLNPDGSPVPLAAGLAFELSEPGRPPVRMFTNRSGRFAATGLKAGRWRIEVETGSRTRSYIIEIPADAPSLVRAGELQPEDTP